MLDRARHARGVLPVQPHVREDFKRRTEAAQVVRVERQPLRGAIAAGQLVVVAHVRVHGSAGLLLCGARVPVVVDVAVRDENPPHFSQAAADGAKTREQRIAPFARPDSRIEQREAASVFLDDVDVRGAPRFGERDRHRYTTDAELIEKRGAHPSFLTASLSSGSALKRSATSP